MLLLTSLFLLKTLTLTTSREPCMPNGRMCVANATCKDQKCICSIPFGLQGDGVLECALPDEHLCTVMGDPHLKTFEGASASIYLPCRYRLSKFITRFKFHSVVHMCDFEIYSFSRIFEGKHVAGGLEVKVSVDVDVEEDEVSEMFEFLLDETGIIGANADAIPWGSAGKFKWHGVRITCRFDMEDMFAILEVAECGTRFKFRPYNSQDAGRAQRRMPGVSIVAPPNAVFRKQGATSRHPPNALCGGSGRRGRRGDDISMFVTWQAKLGLASVDEVVTYDILLQNLPQKIDFNKKEKYQLPFTQDCRAAMNVFNLCKPRLRVDAVRVCSGILRHPELVTCLGEDLMASFTDCLKTVCRRQLCAENTTFPYLQKCKITPSSLQREKKRICGQE